MSWSEGYVSDLEYTRNYYRELCPQLVRLALLHRGVLPPELERPRYLELGFGQGVSLNVHAAAGAGEYYGTDFNPTHLVRAQEAARASGAKVTLLDASFAELLDQDLPQMDCIVMHGIWSWVSEENQLVILQLLRRFLRPGGVVHVSYNVMPGWAAMAPVQQLLRLHADVASAAGSGSMNQLKDALQFVQQVDAAGARYFKANPVAQKRIKSMTDKDPRYLAHEFLNAHWRPSPFAHTAALFDEAKLSFAGSADLSEHFDGLHLTPEGQALLRTVSDERLRETTRDFLVGQQFRRDLYVRGVNRTHVAGVRQLQGDLGFVISTPPDAITLEIKGNLGLGKLQDTVYGPVISQLAADGMRPKTVREIHEAVGSEELTQTKVLEALMLLTAKGDAQPTQHVDTQKAARQTSATLNRFSLESARNAWELSHLASPVTGGGVIASRIEQLFLLARATGQLTPEEWARFAWGVLQEQGKRLLKDGKRIDSLEENATEMTRQALEFAEKRLPLLKVLEVA